MEKIKSLLGLVVHNECIMDRFSMILVKFAERVAGKIIGEEDVCPEKEVGHLERKVEISGNEEEKVYREALRRLAELRPEYKKYLPRRGKKKKAPWLSDLLKRRIRLAVWVGTGNEIPFGNLNVIFLKNLLKGKGYSYRRKRGGRDGWYLDGQFVGKDLYRALQHLEKLEAVDRSRLTIRF